MAIAHSPTSVDVIEDNEPLMDQAVVTHDPKRWFIVCLLALGAVIAFMSRTNISTVLTLKSFIQMFHLTDVDRGALNSAFFWSYAALQVPMGWIVDRYGVKWPYAISLVIWSIASAATGLTHTMFALMTLRIITGAGEAIVVPASYRWMRDNFSEGESGLGVGIYMVGNKVGLAIGAPLAVWLIQKYNWQMMFVICSIAGLVWLLPWLLVIKNNTGSRNKANAGKKPAVAVPLANIFSSPVVWGTIIINFCYNYFTFYCMTWMPAYFVEQRHLSLAKMGLWSFYSFSGIAIVAILAGWVADIMIRRGLDAVIVRKWFTIAGFVIACTELLGARTSNINVALFWAVVSLSGLGLATANHLALCRLTLIPAGAVGLVSGFQNVSTSIAGIVGPLLSGWLKQKSGGYQAPMEVIFVFLVLGALTCLVLLRREWAPKVPLPESEAEAA